MQLEPSDPGPAPNPGPKPAVLAVERDAPLTLPAPDGVESGLTFDGFSIKLWASSLGTQTDSGREYHRLLVDGRPVPADHRDHELSAAGGSWLCRYQTGTDIHPGSTIEIELLDASGTVTGQLIVEVDPLEIRSRSLRPPAALAPAALDNDSEICLEMESLSGPRPMAAGPCMAQSLAARQTPGQRFFEDPFWLQAAPSTAAVLAADSTALATKLIEDLLVLNETRTAHQTVAAELLADVHLNGVLNAGLKTSSGLTALVRETAGRIRATLVDEQLSDELSDEIGAAVEEVLLDVRLTQGALARAPKRYFPELIDDLQPGDVVQLLNGTRMFVSSIDGDRDQVIVRQPGGEVSCSQNVLYAAFHSAQVEFVERGSGAALQPGVEAPLYTSFLAREYFNAGDLIYGSSGALVEITAPAHSESGGALRAVLPDGSASFEHLWDNRRLKAELGSPCFCTDRQDLVLEPAELLERLRAVERAHLNAFEAPAAGTVRQPRQHPAQRAADDSLKAVELMAAEFIQSQIDRSVLVRTAAQKDETKKDAKAFDLLLSDLQYIKELRQALGAQISQLTDVLLLSETELDGVEEFQEFSPGTGPQWFNGRRLDRLQYLRELIGGIETELRQTDLSDEARADLLSGCEHALKLVIEVADVTKGVIDETQDLEARLVKKYGAPDGAELCCRTQFEDLSRVDSDFCAALRDLAATVPWSATKEEAEQTGALFHYDPRIIDRLIRLPGAQLITFSEYVDGQNAAVLGALICFPPESLPEEIRQEAALAPFQTAFEQLIIVHPDARSGAAVEMLLKAHAVHLQRTDAKGSFLSIPEGNLPSFGAHFKHGAYLNHADWPDSRRQDGSPVLKRGLLFPAHPNLRSLTRKGGRPGRRARLKLLKGS